MSPRLDKRRTQGWRSWAVCVLFLIGWAARAVHVAAPHEICPIDGKLVHCAHGHEHADEDHSGEDHHAEESSHGPRVRPGDADGEHGDHCSLPEGRDELHPVRLPVPSASMKTARRETALRPDAVPARQIALVLLAPKNSPPTLSA